MSVSGKVSCTCEKCGTKFEGTIWHSVNADVDPELREKLINRKLMIFTCSGCGLKSQVSYDLLYHDMNRGFMIWLVHSDKERHQISEAPLDEEFQVMEGYQFRLVGTYNQLLEKILIFESSLDDIAIEFYKNMIIEKPGPGGIQLHPGDVYYSHIIDNRELLFELLREDQQGQMYCVRKEAYLDKLDHLKKYFGDMETMDPRWMIVDHNFTRSLETEWRGKQMQPQSKRHGFFDRLFRG